MLANLQTTYQGDVVVVKVWTDVLSSGLQDTIQQLLYRDHRKFVLDVKQTQHLALADISIIISAWTTVCNKSGELVLVMLPNETASLVEKMRLTSLVATYSTVEAAVKSFGRMSRAA